MFLIFCSHQLVPVIFQWTVLFTNEKHAWDLNKNLNWAFEFNCLINLAVEISEVEVLSVCCVLVYITTLSLDNINNIYFTTHNMFCKVSYIVPADVCRYHGTPVLYRVKYTFLSLLSSKKFTELNTGHINNQQIDKQ